MYRGADGTLSSLRAMVVCTGIRLCPLYKGQASTQLGTQGAREFEVNEVNLVSAQHQSEVGITIIVIRTEQNNINASIYIRYSST